MSLIPSDRNNPCPVCESTSGKCRQGREDEKYWQCMVYSDAKKGEILSGYKCIGHTRDQLWAQFRLDNSQEWSEQQHQDWQRENERRRNEKARENDERRRRSLSAAQRHEQYTRLLGELTLHPEDRADLVRRGFTHEQIELSGFKSIERYQRLRSRYSELLPGISRGDRLIIRDEGYLCPIRNADGLIVACQVRLRTLPTTESNRYRWLSGQGQTLHLFPEGCVEGELPLGVFRPEGKPEEIALAEGTGAKPFLVSQRLNLLTIGAAGGLWASSLQLCKLALEKAAFEVEGKVVKIFPDAGDILNKSVMTRWQRVIDLLEEWGWSVQFGWWGQIDKSHPDIDELTDYSNIEYLSPSEFLAIGRKHGSLPKEGFAKGIKQQIERGVQNLVDKFAPKAEKNLVEESEPDREEYEAYLQREQQQLETELAQVKERQHQFQQTYPERAKAAWRKARRFTADIQKATQWFEADLPPENSIFLGRSGLGSGKTTRLIQWVKQWKQQGKGFICLGYRNSLLLQLCDEKRLGFYHLHESDSAIMQRDPSSGIALCVDSLWRFKPEDFDGKIIIIDELMSVIRHLLHSPTVKGRDNILELFHQALQRASQVVCLDGNLADWAVKYLHELAPEKKIIRVNNTYQGDKAPINYLLGTIDIDEEVKKNDRSPWLHHLLNESQVPAICADSQVFAESLDNLLSERGLKVLRTLTGIDKDQDIIAKLWGIIQQSKNSHFQASNQIQAIANYEKGNLRECVLEALKASGYKVRCCTLNPEKATGETVKGATEATKRQNCHDIFTAEKIAVEFAKELSKKFDAKWEDRVKVLQATYRDRLPGIEETQSWSEEFIYKIKYDNPDFLNQQEMFWLFSHPEVALRMNQERYHRLAQKEHTFIGNIRSRMAKIKALHDIGIEPFLNPENSWQEDSSELLELVTRCKDEKIAAALGKHPGQQTNIRFLGSLLKMLGLKHTGQKVKSVDGDYRVYRLDRNTLSDLDRQNALECLTRRWENYLTQEVEILDWNQVLYPQAEGNLEPISAPATQEPQAQTEQASEAVPRTPSEYIYINSRSWNELENQGVGEDLREAVDPVDPVGELVEAFEFCEQLRQFVAVIEGYSAEVVEKAIALTDTAPRRRQLEAWFEQLSQEAIGGGGELAHGEEVFIPDWKRSGYAELLRDALKHGVEAFKLLLNPWSETERWAAILKLEEIAPEAMVKLMQAEPNWSDLCIQW